MANISGVPELSVNFCIVCVSTTGNAFGISAGRRLFAGVPPDVPGKQEKFAYQFRAPRKVFQEEVNGEKLTMKNGGLLVPIFSR